MNKIRVMVVERSLLLAMGQFEDLQFESESHHVRYETLKTMRQLYLSGGEGHALTEMEIVLPASGG